jgi:hypothetical protein
MSILVPPPPIRTPLAGADGTASALWSRYFIESQRTLVLDVAPANARYVVLTANPSLTAESNLGGLSAGYLTITVASGVASPSTTATIPASDLVGTLPTANLPDPLPAVSGINLTALNASALSGTIPTVNLPDPLPALDGSALTALNASALASGTVAAARLPLVLTSGTYTPTLTGVVNVAASTAYLCQYLRVGSVVMVSGQVDIDPTAAGDIQLGLSLPVASAFATPEQCAGSAVSAAVAGQCAAILGDVANARAVIQWQAVDTANRAMMFSFSYLVV